jgi:mevalonate kinase
MAGALGAKISGAGGGDCIIVLSPSHKNEIQKALKIMDAHILPVETSVEGVRIET